MIIWRLSIACWIPKATNTHIVCVTLIAFPLQQQLHERASMLRHTYIGCLFLFCLLIRLSGFCLPIGIVLMQLHKGVLHFGSLH
jgi:hypothetical protein